MLVKFERSVRPKRIGFADAVRYEKSGFRYVTESDIWGVIPENPLSGEVSPSAARASLNTQRPQRLFFTYVGGASKALVRYTDNTST